jgi:hypothetical protein
VIIAVHDSRPVLLEKLAEITAFLGGDLRKNFDLPWIARPVFTEGKTSFEGQASRQWNKGRLANFASAIHSKYCELLAWTSKLVVVKVTMTFVCVVLSEFRRFDTRPSKRPPKKAGDCRPGPQLALAAISFPCKDGLRLEPINKTRSVTEAVLVIGVGQWIGITGQDPIQLDRSNGEIVVNVNIQTTTEGHGEGMLSSTSANGSSARNDRFAQIGVAV